MPPATDSRQCVADHAPLESAMQQARKGLDCFWRLFFKGPLNRPSQKDNSIKNLWEGRFAVIGLTGRLIHQRIVLLGRSIHIRFHRNVNLPSRKGDLEVFLEGQFLWNSLQEQKYRLHFASHTGFEL